MKDYKVDAKDIILEELAVLCDKYDLSFEYFCDDDGIHIYAGRREIFKDFLTRDNADGRPAEILRTSKEYSS